MAWWGGGGIIKKRGSVDIVKWQLAQLIRATWRSSRNQVLALTFQVNWFKTRRNKDGDKTNQIAWTPCHLALLQQRPKIPPDNPKCTLAADLGKLVSHRILTTYQPHKITSGQAELGDSFLTAWIRLRQGTRASL